MKTSCVVVGLLLTSLIPSAADAPPQDTPFAVTERGANHNIWERTTYETTGDGTVVPHVHRYQELTTGLNFQQNGQWIESKEEIVPGINGGASAVQGQHQTYFPYDIYSGVIELDTPDGQHLQSRPLGISYFDGSNSVLIAELTNSIGQISGNQVIYTNAFSDFKADLVCTYRKSGFECDVVFRQQPPGPETYGLNPATTRLQLLTEFFNTPEPEQVSQSISVRDGLSDTTLKFGFMRMGRGSAFLVGDNGGEPQKIPVYKTWTHLEGRTFLIEEVPFERIEPQLQTLAMSTVPNLRIVSKDSVLHHVSTARLLPRSRTVQASAKTLRVSKVDLNQKPGVVLDYVTLNSSQTNYTFQGDTTYLISGTVNISGTTTIEGGAVLKFTTNANTKVSADVVNCQTAPYRPAVFTAKDDNSIGETISGSSGTPSGHYASVALQIQNTNTSLGHLRFLYATTAIFYGGNGGPNTLTARHVQILHCGTGVQSDTSVDYGDQLYVYNALLSDVQTAFDGCTWYGGAGHLTVDGCNTLTQDGCDGFFGFTIYNSVLANVTNVDAGVGASGVAIGLYNCPNGGYWVSGPMFDLVYTNSTWPFQTVGGGQYYLAQGSSLRNLGITTNYPSPDNGTTTLIDSTLSADVQKITTYPPLVYSNATISVATNFGPQAQRNTDTPDLGYHYDPLDYIADIYSVTNATLTVWSGTAVASYNRASIQLRDGSAIVSTGTPLNPNWFVRYSSVQEQPVSLGGTNVSLGQNISAAPYGSAAPGGTFRFSKFATPAGGGFHFSSSGSNSFGSLLVQDCELWSGTNVFSGYTNSATVTLKNDLFWRSAVYASNVSAQVTLALSNNLVWGTSVTLNQPSNGVWYAFNNAFDSCALTNCTLTNGYNAYLSGSGRLNPTNAHDVVIASLSYQSGPLGNYYQPTNGSLIDAGSTTADLVGLYHYTTQTNQVKETNSIVDIGYHYVALDGNNNPMDADGDGIPDYVEDVNGNGVKDSGETDWQDALDPGLLKVLITRPRNNSTIP